MRILHVNSGNLYGGIEVLLVTLAKHRDLCPAMTPEFALCFPGRTQEELAETGAAVHLVGPVRVSRPWTIWGARRRLRALLRETSYDVVICHGSWSHSLFASVVRKSNIPLVMWLHNPPLEARLHWLDHWASWNPPDLTICNSEYTRQGAVRLFPRGKNTRIYCPVHFPEELALAKDRQTIRAKYDTPEDAVVILQVGRWAPYKGHTLLMEALARLSQVPGWICWQVGGVQNAEEQSYLSAIQQATVQFGIDDRVRFLGFQNNQTELPRIMAAADVHCQPNIGAEPFGIVFIEALQSRLPVVTTALGGATEIVDDSCGILVPPGDAQKLADALQRLIGSPSLRQQLARGGPSRARTLTDPAAQLGQLADELEKLAARGERIALTNSQS